MGMKLNHHPKQPESVDAISNTRLTLVPTRNRGSQGSEKGFYQCFTVIWIYKGPFLQVFEFMKDRFGVIWIYKGPILQLFEFIKGAVLPLFDFIKDHFCSYLNL
jgi:hypothetical protein